MGKGITRRRYGGGYPRPGSRARALYAPRWTLGENPSSQPGRDLARKYKTAQNFRNWWLRISGTHTPNSTRFHQSSIKPPTMSLNTPKPPTVKSLILLGLRVGGLGSFGLKAIRNRQVASSTLALGSNIPFTSSALRILL